MDSNKQCSNYTHISGTQDGRARRENGSGWDLDGPRSTRFLPSSLPPLLLAFHRRLVPFFFLSPLFLLPHLLHASSTCSPHNAVAINLVSTSLCWRPFLASSFISRLRVLLNYSAPALLRLLSTLLALPLPIQAHTDGHTLFVLSRTRYLKRRWTDSLALLCPFIGGRRTTKKKRKRVGRACTLYTRRRPLKAARETWSPAP